MKFKLSRIKQSLHKTVVPFCFLLIGILLIMSGCVRNSGSSDPTEVRATAREKSNGLLSAGKYRGLAIADIDNDGNPDVIGGSSWPGSVAVWYGDGLGGLSEPQFLPFKGDVRSVAVADIDGDGLKDIICSAQREAAGILVWRNKSGQRWEQGPNPVETGKYEGVAAADVNRDGYTDIVAACSTSDDRGGVRVWLNDGKGNWLAETGPTIQGLYMSVALADLNSDGNLDLVGAGWGTYGALRLWFGDGTGSWSAASTLNTGSYYGITIKDFDGDGKSDILVATYRNGIQIFAGDGEGHFIAQTGPTVSGSFWQAFLTEEDSEGGRMLLAGSLDSNGIAAWKSSGDVWQPVTGRFPSAGIFYQMATGDLNRDGRDDLLAASFEEGVKVWLGKGDGGTTYASRQKGTSFGQEITSELADVKENVVFTTVSGTPEYKIGPGDVLEITLWRGTQSVKEEVAVRSNGRISFSFVEDLNVSGLTATQLDKVLSNRLSEFIKHPRIDIFVKKHLSKFATLVGAIAYNPNYRSGPGKYNLKGKTTLLEMVTRAGGPTKDANLSKVNIRRGDGRAFSVDLFKVFTEGDRTQNIVLDDGDLIIIPTISTEENRVYIFGEVNKPGLYTFAGTGKRVFDLLSEAGGVTVFAKEASTKIVRGDIARPEVISADLKKLIETGDISQNVMLANGDLVYVPRSFVGDINRFVKQITPLMRLVIYPPQLVNEYQRASDYLKE